MRLMHRGKFFPPNWGGVEEFAEQLHRVLGKMAIETHCRLAL